MQTFNSFIFAKLLFVFSCSIADRTFSVCSIQPLDANIYTRPAKDKELRLCRVRAKPDKEEFVFARSIIRGAPLIPDFDRQGDYLVMDVVDHTGDLFLRCQDIFGI